MLILAYTPHSALVQAPAFPILSGVVMLAGEEIPGGMEWEVNPDIHLGHLEEGLPAWQAPPRHIPVCPFVHASPAF